MPSDQQAEDSAQSYEGGIGSLFRAHGEDYIRIYQPDLRTIKLIRAVRICRTPALGGKLLRCQSCAHSWYQYFSCGHSHCPICQGNKRQAWYERIDGRLLEVPYLHITFTLPHELNGLCRLHPKPMYNLLLRTAWQTIRQLCKLAKVLGGLPGMTAVLHTWGSDLKYHVHAHCLVTFGGWDEQGQVWRWPKEKDKLVGHRKLRHTFRGLFLAGLKQWMNQSKTGGMAYHQSYEVLSADLLDKSWVVNQQPPTIDAQLINAYLSRYICRIGISDARLPYDPIQKKVRLEYKDYRRQKAGEAAPIAYRELEPLVAMQQILQHLLPAHFHRSRSYGLHAPATRKRLGNQLGALVQSNTDTIRLLFRLLKYLLLQPLPACEACGDTRPPRVEIVAPDRGFLSTFLTNLESRAPPRTVDQKESKKAA